MATNQLQLKLQKVANLLSLQLQAVVMQLVTLSMVGQLPHGMEKSMMLVRKPYTLRLTTCLR